MKKVDSSEAYFASAKMDRHALQSKARDDDKKTDSSVKVDRHAACAARDDRNLFFQQDSRSCGGAVVALRKFWGRAMRDRQTRRRILGLASNAPNLNKQAKDSKICDEKAGLRSLLRGDKPRWLSHKQKASSLLYRAKLNLPKEQKWN